MSQPGQATSHVTRADVELRVPADSAYVSVLRTTTVGLAARLDFTLDDIEDLRMSVGEACALVLPLARPGGDLTCGFVMSSGELRVNVSVATDVHGTIEEDSFGWQVLSTLASEVSSHATNDEFVLTLTMRATQLDLGS